MSEKETTAGFSCIPYTNWKRAERAAALLRLRELNNFQAMMAKRTAPTTENVPTNDLADVERVIGGGGSSEDVSVLVGAGELVASA